MTGPYTFLARFYDRFMDVDYEQWEHYLLAVLEKHNCAPRTILDLGCGTATLTVAFARRGYLMTAVDISPEMIGEAKVKAAEEGQEISFFVQDMRELSLPNRQYDLIFSSCDVLNYVTRAEDLGRVFAAVSRHLRPGGLFLFDLNSAYKLQNIYGEQCYAELTDDLGFFWDNSYDWDQHLCQMDLTFFILGEEGLYTRQSETHRQKLWTARDIRKIAGETNLQFLACYDFSSFQACSEQSERWQLVLKKKV